MTWTKLAIQLAASRESKGLPRINVAAVDTSESEWLAKRFSITSVPVVLLFKGGVMYSFGVRHADPLPGPLDSFYPAPLHHHATRAICAEMRAAASPRAGRRLLDGAADAVCGEGL